MRRSLTLLFTIGAVVSAGLLAHLAASAAGFSLMQSGTSTTSTSSTSSTTSGGTSATAAGSEEVNTALFALAAGGKTLGGPGTFLAGADGSARIYQVLTGMAPNACVTLRNLSSSQIRVSVNDAISNDVGAGETSTSCYAVPAAIDLRCRQGTACLAVWRIDRHQ